MANKKVTQKAEDEKKVVSVVADYTKSDEQEQAELVKLANAAHERQALVSTSVQSQGQKECPRMKLVKQFIGEDALPGRNGEDPKVYPFFIENTRQERLKHAASGGLPVNYEGQFVLTEGGDLLCQKPYAYYKQSLLDAKLESNQRLQAKDKFEEDGADMKSMRKAGYEDETKIVQGVSREEALGALSDS